YSNRGRPAMFASTATRVIDRTSNEANRRIRRQTQRNIQYYAQRGLSAIDFRLRQLDREWDVERALEANAASAVILGTLMGTFASKRWFLLNALVGGFLLQHALDGWCPPLPVYRSLGFRTAREIEDERTGLLRARMDIVGCD